MKVSWKKNKKHCLPTLSHFAPFDHHQQHSNNEAEDGARVHHPHQTHATQLATKFQAQGDKLAMVAESNNTGSSGFTANPVEGIAKISLVKGICVENNHNPLLRLCAVMEQDIVNLSRFGHSTQPRDASLATLDLVTLPNRRTTSLAAPSTTAFSEAFQGASQINNFNG
ncbi:hypothetical protein Fmac_007277 [Flemingia macrophylla]|uniref:Uncharacterized protein n=1 Tax=Flemingia macrophylla TaxID=520843 RepID=A0ABD1NE85_9FABA